MSLVYWTTERVFEPGHDRYHAADPHYQQRGSRTPSSKVRAGLDFLRLTFSKARNSRARRKGNTLGKLKFRNCLPFVRSDEPGAVFAATAEVYYELVLFTAQHGENGLQPRLREFAGREEERRDDDLLCFDVSIYNLGDWVEGRYGCFHPYSMALHTFSAPHSIHCWAF